MKKQFAIILIVFITLFSFTSSWGGISIITAVQNNGLWNSPSSWDQNRIPQSNDFVKIPTGITIRINNNMYHDGQPNYPLLNIEIKGTLQFIGVGQLNLACGTMLCVMEFGMIPYTGSNSNQITIGPGLAKWKGDQNSFTNACLSSENCTPFLPLQLVEFSATSLQSSSLVKWKVANVSAFSHFELETSSDGITFHFLDHISYHNENDFFYTDANRNNKYYKLKLVDVDGSHSYSEIVSIEHASDGNIYPNPCTTKILHLDHSLVNSPNSYCMLNTIGAIVQEGPIASQINLESLASGVYTFVIKGETIFTKQVIIP